MESLRSGVAQIRCGWAVRRSTLRVKAALLVCTTEQTVSIAFVSIEDMDTNTLLIILVVVLLLGGGGFFYRGRVRR